MATQEDPELTRSTDVPNLHLFIEQFPLKKDGGLGEQLLHSKRDHRENCKRDGDVVAKGTTIPDAADGSREGQYRGTGSRFFRPRAQKIKRQSTSTTRRQTVQP